MDSRTPFNPTLARWHPKAKEGYAAALRKLDKRIESERRHIQAQVPPAHQGKARRKLNRLAEEMREQLKQQYGHPPGDAVPDAGDSASALKAADQMPMF